MSGGADDRKEINQAAAWFARLRADDCTAADEATFRAWIESAPEHDTAMKAADAAWRATGAIADNPAILALRREASATPSTLGRRTFIAAGGTAAALAAFGLVPAQRPASRTASNDGGYETAVGQRLSVPLPDGSVLTLNTATRLRVALSPSERAIFLAQGQFIAEVAKDASRPFVVHAAGRRIVAVGTEFDVRLKDDDIEVTLLEGRVVVDSGPGAKHSELQPGERLTVKPDGPVSVEPVSAERLTSWRSGLLVFENDPLSAAVAEVNRYSQAHIVLSDERVRELRVSGVFMTGQPDRFVAALTRYFPLRAVNDTGDSIRIEWQARDG